MKKTIVRITQVSLLILCMACASISKDDFEGTWYITGSEPASRNGIRYAWIQFKGGEYTIFWMDYSNTLYFFPQRDDNYLFYSDFFEGDVLFLKKDYVSYRVDFTTGDNNIPSKLYLEVLSKKDTSHVRFQNIRLTKQDDKPIFNVEDRIAKIPLTNGSTVNLPVNEATYDYFQETFKTLK